MSKDELDPKVCKILDSNIQLQHHYDFLLNKKRIADKALKEFITRVENDYADEITKISEQKTDPTSIVDYTQAMDFIRNITLKNASKLEEIQKYITQQQELEKVWEYTHHRLINDSKTDDDTLNAFYNECMRQLEEFSKKCHQKFHALEIPLFCLKKELQYKNLSKDRRNLIAFIQDEAMKK